MLGRKTTVGSHGLSARMDGRWRGDDQIGRDDIIYNRAQEVLPAFGFGSAVKAY